jgi:ABC-type transport system substrate-binding protein
MIEEFKCLIRRICSLLPVFFNIIISASGFAHNQPYLNRMHSNMIEIAIKSLPATVDPRSLILQHHMLVIQNLYQTLTRINEDGRLVSDLADKWEIVDSGRTININISNAYFHDGTKITSQDVRFTLARHLWPSSKSAAKGYLRSTIEGALDVSENAYPEGIIAPSPSTLVIKLKKPYAPFLFILSMPIFGVVSHKHLMTSKQLVGSGPMKLRSLSREMAVLERYDAYTGVKPRARELHIAAVPNGDTMMDLVRSGSLDVAMIGMNNRLAIGKLPSGFEEVRHTTLSYTHLFCNTNNPTLSGESLRRDLAALIQTYASDYPVGSQELNLHYFPPGIMPPSYYNHRQPKHLDSVAFSNIWGSKLKKSSPLRIVANPDLLSPEFLDGLSRVLNAASVPHIVEQVNGEELFKRVFDGSYDLIAGSYIGNFPDPDGLLDPILHASGWGFGVFNVDELKSAIEAARFLPSQEDRLAKYSEAIRRFEESGIVIPLFRERFRIVHNSKIKIPEGHLRFETEIWNMIWLQP